MEKGHSNLIRFSHIFLLGTTVLCIYQQSQLSSMLSNVLELVFYYYFFYLCCTDFLQHQTKQLFCNALQKANSLQVYVEI